MSSRQLYVPIKPHETRIVCLHGLDENAESPVVCDLHVAQLIDSRFEGLRVEGLSEENQGDGLVQYDALSYAWGSGGAMYSVVCNDVEFPVSESLYAAMQELRLPRGEMRFLWIDAICINQNDNREKSFQVANMFLIFRKARSVIAWLGLDDEYIRFVADVLLPAGCSENDNPSQDPLDGYAKEASDRILEQVLDGISDDGSGKFSGGHSEEASEDEFEDPPYSPAISLTDFWKICKGLKGLYARSWFRRVWVQQEIYAARRLQLRCGPTQLQSIKQLFSPKQWLTPSIVPAEREAQLTRPNAQPEDFPSDIDAEAALKKIEKLQYLQRRDLRCFHIFTATKSKSPPDFIECLVNTGSLQATNPLDHIYGILQMTTFPSRVVSIADWLTLRDREMVVPIDYDAPLSSLLCAVTWVLLMECGLPLLMKFKAFHTTSDEDSDYTLPSWAIDWRLTSEFLHKGGVMNQSYARITLANIWDFSLDESGIGALAAGKLPAAHEQFRSDNCSAALPINKLVVRGKIMTSLYVKKNDTRVWEVRSGFSKAISDDDDDEAIWDTQTVLQSDDFVIWVPGTARPHRQSIPNPSQSTALWLLRPVGQDEYRLIACLCSWEASWDEAYISCPYHHWISNSLSSDDAKGFRRALTPGYEDAMHQIGEMLGSQPSNAEECSFMIV